MIVNPERAATKLQALANHLDDVVVKYENEMTAARKVTLTK